jgi:hypothetical protein
MQLFQSPVTNPPAKYTANAASIQNGDIVLYRGTGVLAKAIQYFDSAYFNHVGVVWIPDNTNRQLTFDMWSDGLDCLPLPRRMSGYEDFCVIRPKISQADVDNTVISVLNMWDGSDISYNYWMLLRIAIIKKTGINITGLDSGADHFICSEFAKIYTETLGLATYSNLPLITPQDFIRHIDPKFFDLLLYNGPVL